MKFQPGMKISNFPYNQFFFQIGMKIWYYAGANSLFTSKKNKDGNFTSTFQIDPWQIYQSENIYKNLKVPWNSETVTQTLKNSNYMKVWEKV